MTNNEWPKNVAGGLMPIRHSSFLHNFRRSLRTTPRTNGGFQEWRPKMFILTGCTNLVVRDITFGDAPEWGLHMLGCHKVLVDGVKVRNHLVVLK